MIRKYIIPVLICFPLFAFSQHGNLFNELELAVLRSDYDSSIVIANTLLMSDSADWKIFYYLGKSYQSKYKYFEAIKNYEKANDLDSANSVIENSLAGAYDFIGKDEDAIQIYYNQYLRDTIDIGPIVNMANIFRKNREYAPAIHYYQKATAIDPQNFFYYKQLAFCYDKINISIGAVLSYKTAIMLNPYDKSSYIQLANILNTNRSFQEGIDVCNNGLEYYPQSEQLLKLKSYAQYLNKDFDSSIVGFNKLLEKGDSIYFNLKYQGLALFEKKEFEKAVKDLNAAIEINDNDAETFFYLGSAFARSGNNDEGMKYLNKSLKLLEPSPNELSNVYSEMAYVFQNQQKYELALKYLKLAYKYDATPLLSFKMGQLYDYFLDNKKLAINYYDGYLTMANEPDTLRSDSTIIQDSFTQDSTIIKNATQRIRILKEELFFEDSQK